MNEEELNEHAVKALIDAKLGKEAPAEAFVLGWRKGWDEALDVAIDVIAAALPDETEDDGETE